MSFFIAQASEVRRRFRLARAGEAKRKEPQSRSMRAQQESASERSAEAILFGSCRRGKKERAAVTFNASAAI